MIFETVKNGKLTRTSKFFLRTIYLYKDSSQLIEFYNQFPENYLLLDLDNIDENASFLEGKEPDWEKLRKTPLIIMGELSYKNLRLIEKAKINFLSLFIF